MLKKLRWQLTLYYFLISLLLIALMGGGAYWLLSQYFQQTTDLAMQYRMAKELERYGLSLPEEMATATERWCELNQLPIIAVDKVESDEDEDHDEYDQEVAYNPDLAIIFVYPLDETGRLLFDPNSTTPNFSPDIDAVQQAQLEGCDWRTVMNPDGKKVRLFTYPLPAGMAPAVLQIGRFVEGQQQTLRQLMVGILALASISMLLLGAGGWYLAGKSLLPTQKAWERQQVFIANASHELRTPLTLMRATSEVAFRRALDPRQKELLSEVLNETDYMAQLVDDLLLLSRFDAGQLQLSFSEVNASEFIEEIVADLRPVAEKKGMSIETSVEDGALWIDPLRIRELLIILIDNAITHSKENTSIQIEARNFPDKVVIHVNDGGEGISEEHLAHLFERFHQGSSSKSGARQGAGLGLSIAKSIVEAHGGSIIVSSKIGVGTSVQVSLPLQLTVRNIH